MKLIVGLGNPGQKYLGNRHNVGFMTIDLLMKRNDILINKEKFRSGLGEGRIGREKVVLMKPLTYMNNSGMAVVDFANYYNLEPKDIIVITDDIDIPWGSIRIKQKGSAGSHNGLKSIIYHLKSQDFPRVKIAVGKKHPKMDLADFVLSNFTNEEQKILELEIEDAAKAVELIAQGKLNDAMNRYNGLNHSEE
ncbi:MAG: aminoacyl-tRNA hydrolase [Lagierella massiliensis]|nr:aminoacyl-tRNA hydrolase [Lagierella massiliensis]